MMTHQVQFPKLGISFNVTETAFSIGSFNVQWYGIIIAAGFLLALIYASRSAKKMNINMDRFFDAVIVGLIGSIIGARLYYVIFYPGDKYWNDPLKIFDIHEGGVGIYGGIIGAVICGGIMAKIRKLNLGAVLDVTSLGFLIGQGVGRWGNFINQEAFGTPTSMPWGMYSDNTALMFPDSPVHPCFFYESVLCFVGFILLHIFTRRYRRYDGQTFLLYIAWYGFIRFFIEGLRTDSLIVPFFGWRVSQVVALASVAAAAVLLFVFRHKTSLSGCGSRKIMEANGLAEVETLEDDGKSTIFGDLTPVEDKDAEREGQDGKTPESENKEEPDAIEEACKRISEDLDAQKDADETK